MFRVGVFMLMRQVCKSQNMLKRLKLLIVLNLGFPLK